LEVVRNNYVHNHRPKYFRQFLFKYFTNFNNYFYHINLEINKFVSYKTKNNSIILTPTIKFFVGKIYIPHR